MSKHSEFLGYIAAASLLLSGVSPAKADYTSDQRQIVDALRQNCDANVSHVDKSYGTFRKFGKTRELTLKNGAIVRVFSNEVYSGQSQYYDCEMKIFTSDTGPVYIDRYTMRKTGSEMPDLGTLDAVNAGREGFITTGNPKFSGFERKYRDIVAEIANTIRFSKEPKTKKHK